MEGVSRLATRTPSTSVWRRRPIVSHPKPHKIKRPETTRTTRSASWRHSRSLALAHGRRSFTGSGTYRRLRRTGPSVSARFGGIFSIVNKIGGASQPETRPSGSWTTVARLFRVRTRCKSGSRTRNRSIEELHSLTKSASPHTESLPARTWRSLSSLAARRNARKSKGKTASPGATLNRANRNRRPRALPEVSAGSPHPTNQPVPISVPPSRCPPH